MDWASSSGTFCVWCKEPQSVQQQGLFPAVAGVGVAPVCAQSRVGVSTGTGTEVALIRCLTHRGMAKKCQGNNHRCCGWPHSEPRLKGRCKIYMQILNTSRSKFFPDIFKQLHSLWYHFSALALQLNGTASFQSHINCTNLMIRAVLCKLWNAQN